MHIFEIPLQGSCCWSTKVRAWTVHLQQKIGPLLTYLWFTFCCFYRCCCYTGFQSKLKSLHAFNRPDQCHWMINNQFQYLPIWWNLLLDYASSSSQHLNNYTKHGTISFCSICIWVYTVTCKPEGGGLVIWSKGRGEEELGQKWLCCCASSQKYMVNSALMWTKGSTSQKESCLQLISAVTSLS